MSPNRRLNRSAGNLTQCGDYINMRTLLNEVKLTANVCGVVQIVE